MPCKPQWNGVNHRSNQHGSGHFSTFLTSLLSSLLYFPHFSTFFTSLLSSLLYFPHSSAFFTSPRSSLLYFHHFAIFVASLHSSLLEFLSFRLYFLETSKRAMHQFLQLSALSLLNLPFQITLQWVVSTFLQPFPRHCLNNLAVIAKDSGRTGELVGRPGLQRRISITFWIC